MSSKKILLAGTVLAMIGLVWLGAVYWMSFFWVSTEVTQGIAQRIMYVHVPAAWTSFLAFGLAALFSAVYLWLRDERLDRAAVSAAEGGMVFATIMLSIIEAAIIIVKLISLNHN